MHKFSPYILREYDIRGVFGDNLHNEDAYHLGKSFALLAIKKISKLTNNSLTNDNLTNDNPTREINICVGRDGRKTSPSLHKNLIKGLGDGGVNVIDIGIGPSPLTYHSIIHQKSDGGIMITGSHNPPEYNGFKMSINSYPIYGEEIKELAKIAENYNIDIAEQHNSKNNVKEIDISNDYITHLLKYRQFDNNIKIAWDCGNGAAGEIIEKLVKLLPNKNIVLFSEIDGEFPNHHPDPSCSKNMRDLQNAVKENQCDIGIAFDGDGDRIGVIDEKGEILNGDELAFILAEDVVKNKQNAKCIFDIKTSQKLVDEINKIGGEAIIYKTGHSLIKSKMIAEKAEFAAEASGHIFYAENYNFDDAIFAAIKITNILANSGRKLSDVRKNLPEIYATDEIRIECADNKKSSVVDSIKAKLKKSGRKFTEIDGVRLMSDKGWWLVRASNTQPCLVMRAESYQKEDLPEISAEMKNIVSEFVDEADIKLGLNESS